MLYTIRLYCSCSAVTSTPTPTQSTIVYRVSLLRLVHGSVCQPWCRICGDVVPSLRHLHASSRRQTNTLSTYVQYVSTWRRQWCIQRSSPGHLPVQCQTGEAMYVDSAATAARMVMGTGMARLPLVVSDAFRHVTRTNIIFSHSLQPFSCGIFV